MHLKIAVINLQSGIGVTRSYAQYLTRGWRYWYGHAGRPVAVAARMLQTEAPDMVLVSEIDEPSRRSRFVSQLAVLKQSTSLAYSEFFPTRNIGESIREGSALLSSFPLLHTVSHSLHTGVNPRVLGQTSVTIHHKRVTVFTTHLALSSSRRAEQIKIISNIIRHTPGPILLGGDFNERKEALHTMFTDVGLTAVTQPSYPSWRPKHHLQALFISSHFTALRTYQPASALFSDHVPLLVELRYNDC